MGPGREARRRRAHADDGFLELLQLLLDGRDDGLLGAGPLDLLVAVREEDDDEGEGQRADEAEDEAVVRLRRARARALSAHLPIS